MSDQQFDPVEYARLQFIDCLEVHSTGRAWSNEAALQWGQIYQAALLLNRHVDEDG